MNNVQAVKQRFGIIGASEALNRALDKAIRVANTDLTALIQGESGTGKEVISKIIHQLSVRKHNNFIAINTGAIPEGTINSELFGHEKGSFTGALGERKGYFETASGGTIFLDEIGEMPLDTQAFLLRVLESGEFIRVGSSKVLKTDVRVIAATNVDLLEKVRQGKFREDLYYRLNTIPIRVPSLKERREDIYMLLRKFSLDFAEKYHTEPITIDAEAKSLLTQYAWPGNIRELRNVVEQLSILSEDKLITTGRLIDLIPNITDRHLPGRVNKESENLNEREILYKVLFDMKADLNDLKSLIYGLVRTNNLDMPEQGSYQHLLMKPALAAGHEMMVSEESANYKTAARNKDFMAFQEQIEDEGAVIVNSKDYNEMEVVEENLSLEDMEKVFIHKALKKFNGRRKEAAAELGISERTLYRKISYYGLD